MKTRTLIIAVAMALVMLPLFAGKGGVKPTGKGKPTKDQTTTSPTEDTTTTAPAEEPATAPTEPAAEEPATPVLLIEKGVWTSADEVAGLPMSGEPWRRLKRDADAQWGTPNIADQDDKVDVYTMAKALVFARTGEESYRSEVISLCMQAIGSESGGRALALGRNLAAYVIAADLVKLPAAEDEQFRTWLRSMLTKRMSDGRTLVSTHEDRPNNWGTHAGGSRVVVAAYLGDTAELERCAKVFKGWVGDRSSYNDFVYGDLFWQSNPDAPVGINPVGARILDRNVDGVLPDDQRRSGDFYWPPPQEEYVYEALQGALLQATVLARAGYDVWNWESKALLRAYVWLHNQANFPAAGDDNWQPFVVNKVYGTSFPAPEASNPGKNVGWTCWTHQ
jgi:hypothetical protein